MVGGLTAVCPDQSESLKEKGNKMVRDLERGGGRLKTLGRVGIDFAL